MQPRARTVRRRQRAGFTLVELLIVVAIIGLLASIAVPALQRAILKSHRNAAVAELRTLRHGLSSYARDVSHYPPWSGRDKLDLKSLAPLVPSHVKRAAGILDSFQGHKLDFYLPWDIVEWRGFDFSSFQSPQYYTIVATLAYKPSIRFMMTDGQLYYWINGKIIPVDDYKD